MFTTTRRVDDIKLPPMTKPCTTKFTYFQRRQNNKQSYKTEKTLLINYETIECRLYIGPGMSYMPLI